ncbi:MAG: hypothetical protein ACREK5_01715 [Gemmatimonadota bacterium]
MRRDASRRFLPVACLILIGCATGSRSGGPEEEPAAPPVAIRVENDLLPRQEVTVRLFRPDGTREILGSVGPGQTRSFRIQESSYAGSFALVAENSSGQELVSRPFSIYPNDIVDWELRLNQLTVGSS